jgi:hypothetical protein
MPNAAVTVSVDTGSNRFRRLDVQIKGTIALTKPAGITISSVLVTARKTNHSGTVLGMANATFSPALTTAAVTDKASEQFTITASSTDATGVTALYWTIVATDNQGYTYTSQTNGTVTALTDTGVTLEDPSAGDRTLTLYGITAYNGAGGTITPSKPAAVIGDTVSLMVQPAADYMFTGYPTVGGTQLSSMSYTLATAGTKAITIAAPTEPTNRFISTDARLTNLTLNGVPIDFSPGTLEYTAPTVENTINQTTVTAAAHHSAASVAVTINNVAATTNHALVVGQNMVMAIVTAESGAQYIYRVNVNRKPGTTGISSAVSGNKKITVRPSGTLTTLAGTGGRFDYYASTSSTPPLDTVTPMVTSTITTTGVAIPNLTNGEVYYVSVRARTSVANGDLAGSWFTLGDSRSPGYTREDLTDQFSYSGAENPIVLIPADGADTITINVGLNVGRDLTLMPPPGKNITLKRGTGGAIINMSTTTGYTVTLGQPGMTGTLTIDGGGIWNEAHTDITGGISAEYPAINVSYGTLAMYPGVTIQNNKDTSTSEYTQGGGILVSTNGKFYMYGGSIINNMAAGSSTIGGSGGGIFVSGGLVDIQGGTISGNRSTGVSTGAGSAYYYNLNPYKRTCKSI